MNEFVGAILALVGLAVLGSAPLWVKLLLLIALVAGIATALRWAWRTFRRVVLWR